MKLLYLSDRIVKQPDLTEVACIFVHKLNTIMAMGKHDILDVLNDHNRLLLYINEFKIDQCDINTFRKTCINDVLTL